MTQTPEDKLEILKIAFEEGRKGLSDQDQTISSIRQRSIWIGGLAGVVATFLGREALNVLPLSNIDVTVESVALLAGFAALCLVYVAIFNVVRPRGNLRFHNSPDSIIKQFVNSKHAPDLSKTYEVLAHFSQDNYKSNDIVISRLFVWLLVATAAMFVEFIAWLFVIA